MVLLSCTGTVDHPSSGIVAWFHAGFISAWSEMVQSEAVSGGVKGSPSWSGIDWHQYFTSEGWEKRNEPGWE
jgi:hypothetical protein